MFIEPWDSNKYDVMMLAINQMFIEPWDSNKYDVMMFAINQMFIELWDSNKYDVMMLVADMTLMRCSLNREIVTNTTWWC